MSGPDQVNWVAGQTGFGSKRVILSELKTGLGQSGCGSGRVEPYFSHDLKKKKKKKKKKKQQQQQQQQHVFAI